MRHISLVLILTSLVTLSACGFHLRGQLPLPESARVIYLDATQSEYTTELSQGLVTAGAALVETVDLAKTIIQIEDEYAEREALTVNATGKATSYKLHYTVEYVIADDKKEELKSGSLTETRQYSFQSGQATLQESEEAELLEEMRKELVIKMVRQLGAL